MGFWSNIAKFAGAGVAAAAIPFTGGASSALIPVALGLGGKAVADMAGGAAANRGERDLHNQNADRTTVTARGQDSAHAQAAAELALKNQTQARNNSDADYKMAMRAALAKNIKDVSMARPSSVTNMSFSGGLRPSAFGAEGQAAADAMNNLAMRRLMNPEEAVQLAPLEKFKASEPTKASFWEKIAGPIGMGLNIAGNVMNARQGNSDSGLVATASDYDVMGDG